MITWSKQTDGGFKVFTLSLIEPEIPPNTGNIARLCAATRSRLELVGKLGFSIDDKAVRRAGLDYWDQVNLKQHSSVEDFINQLKASTFHLFTTKVKKSYTQVQYNPGDRLIFGSETKGLPSWILEKFADRCVTIPMFNPKVRSLNLSNTASIALYEALRQTGQLLQP